MKRVVTILLMLMFNLSFSGEDKIYKSATEFDYPPFSVIKDGIADGFSVELLKEVANEAGIKIDFKVDAWNTIKNELKEGKIDVLPLVGHTQEREEYYDFSVPYMVLQGNIFVRTDNRTINSENDLFGKEIIVMKGDNAHEYAMKRKFSDKLILTETYSEAFKLLSSGKYDAVLAQSLVGFKLINDLALKNIKPVTELGAKNLEQIKVNLSGFEQKFCFAVKEGDKELLEKLNEGLAIVSANGKYKKIYAKWFPFLIENKPSLKTLLIYIASFAIPLLIITLIAAIIIIRREVKRKTEELIKETKERNESENRFRKMVQDMQVGVLVQGPQAEMLLSNDRALELLGITEDQLLGKTSFDPYWNVIHEDGSPFPGETHPVPEAIAGRHTVRDVVMGVYRPLTADRIWLTVDAIPQMNNDGTVKQVICTFKDITKQKHAESELIKAKDRAEKASKAKGEFLSNMSHELRTPLNGILGFSGLLLEDETDIDKREQLSIVVESGKILLSIINDILEMSKIEARMTELKEERLDIDEIIADIDNMFKEMADKKGNKIIVSNKCVTKYIVGDEYRLKQIFINLIGNSNKFTENGIINFGISEKAIDRERTQVSFTITDSGIGIKEDKMNRLFEMFNQGEHFLTKKYGGTGLGLAIVKNMVDLMGGTIDVKSQIDVGTTFDIKIIFRISEESETSASDNMDDNKYNFGDKKVLIVEDSDSNIKLMEQMMKRMGIEFDIALDGQEGIESVAARKYDLILMDIQMPNVNGIEAIKRIREMESGSDSRVPIVAVSAYALKEDIEKILAVGADDYLAKPFLKNHLVEVMKKWLQQ